MSENPEKRRRPNLYKKEDKDEDVLKKLKEVRQNLQESLDDTPEKKGPALTRKRGERRLYKKEDGEQPPAAPVIVKGAPKKQVSAKRLAAVQKRVKAKVEATKGISKKKKALIIIWIIIMSVPLFFITTIAALGVEIDFGGFGLLYNENKKGTIILSFPARNPNFMPMHLSQFEINLYTEDGEYIGKATNNDELTILPYQTERLYITLALEEKAGGEWISDWLSTMVIKLRIGSMVYNGMEVDTSFLPPIEIDTSDILRDMITGLLDIEELINGLDLGSMLGGEEETATAKANLFGAQFGPQPSKIELDPYSNARNNRLLENLMTNQFGDTEDMTLNVSFGMSETDEQFMLGLGATINLKDLVSTEDLGGIVLGPIYMNNLDVQLRVSTSKHYTDKREIEDDDEWYKNYNTAIAKLTTHKQNEIYIADTKDRDSVIGMNMSIEKDNPTLIADNGGIHPSANITTWDESDTSDPFSVANFLAGTNGFNKYAPAWQEFPCWYFLYNFLGRGGLDCGIAIEKVDIEIFGLKIDDVSLSMEILPPLFFEEGVLDPDNFLRMVPDYGIGGMLKHFARGLTEGPARAFLGIPPEPQTSENLTEFGIPPEKDIDTLLTDFTDMVEMPSIDFDSIEESWGDDAKLHIGLPIILHNTMLNFYVGFSGMEVAIASTIGEVSREFMKLKVRGNNTDLVYIAGLNSNVTLNIELDIYKNETVAPFAVKFLSQMIENFTIDGIIKASFQKLILFKENYTYGPFDIAIPLKMDMESIVMGLIESIVPSLVGGLFEMEEDNATETSAAPITPVTMFTGAHQLPALLRVLQSAPLIQQYASQEEEEEEPDAISQMINDLINDLVGSLTGGLLGSEMEFTLGFEVDVFTAKRTEMTIILEDFLVDEFFITIGMGKTDLNLKSTNQYDQWENIVGIKIDDYFEIKAGVREDIEITLVIYETDALCHMLTTFVDEFFTRNQSNIVDLKVDGYTTVNLSGLYMEDLDIDFTLEGLDTGLNGTDMIAGVFDMIYDIELDQTPSKPQLLDLWAGPMTNIPFISQGIDIERLFHLGEINILSISETNFNDKDNGIGQISLAILDNINYMMGIDIKKLEVSIYDMDPVKNASSCFKMAEISIGDGDGLQYAKRADLFINITLFKDSEQKTETWLNNVINSLSLSGYVNFSATLQIFGCDIIIEPTYLPAINLTRLPIDITEIFATVFNPFAAPFMNLMGPRVSQDINMDSIFKNVLEFAIGGISIGDYTPVGPLDYDTSVLDVGVNLWLEPKFNMSINGLTLQLLDGGLYQALHVLGGHNFLDVVKEATIGQVTLNQGPVYFNSCIPGTVTNDLFKPYLVNNSVATWNENASKWECEDVDFILDYNDVSTYTIKNQTEFNVNETEGGGFDDGNVALGLGLKTLNNLGIKVELFNKSHGTWDTRYNRKYWKALGGPYFPVQMYDGYPDHYYVYHPYYAPLVSLVQKALALLDESGIATDEDAINELVKGIAIAGMVNITVFSMDLNINLNNPKINAMFEPIAGMFLGTTAIALKEYIRNIVTPFQNYQDPREMQISKVASAQGIEEIFGDLMDMSSIPLDINDVLCGVSFPGIADRTNHGYSPQTQSQSGESRCWDGYEKWDYQANYSWDPSKIIGATIMDPDYDYYHGSLDDHYFTGEYDGIKKETFIKDVGYNWFKRVTENWAQENGVMNPFFETQYSKKGYYMAGDLIEDESKWPLLYSRSSFGGRCRTSVINLHTGLMLKIPISVLSGKLGLWIENPYQACQYMPMGYAWFNESVNMMTIDEMFADPYVDAAMPAFLEGNAEGLTWGEIQTNYATTGLLGQNQAETDIAVLALCQCGVNASYQMDDNGKPKEDGWVLNVNIRFFEGLGSREFFWQMVSEGSFNIHFLAQGMLNFSFCGYEFYDLFLPYDIAQLGDPSTYAERCGYYAGEEGGGGYENWGIPGFNGTTTTPDEEEDEEYWPHYLLEPETLEFAVSLPLDAILGMFTDFGSLLTELLGGIDTFELVGLQILRLGVHLPISNPVPLALFITDVTLIIKIAEGSLSSIDWDSPSVFTIYAVDTANIPLIDLSESGIDPEYNPSDPYDFRYNSYIGWHTPHPVILAIDAEIPLNVPGLLGLLGAILGGSELWLVIHTVEIDVVVPNMLDYQLDLIWEDLDDMQEPMNVMDMLGGLF